MPAPQNEVHRPGLLQIAWQRRWTVLLTLIVCLAGGAIYLAKATPIYVSVARLYVEQAGPKIMSESEGVMTQSKNYLFTQAELLAATPILAVVAEKPEVARMRTFANVDNRLGMLKSELRVDVGKKDDIISAELGSPYPEEAAQIVNAIVDEYLTYQAHKKNTTASEVLKILQAEKAKRETDLEGVYRRIMDFRGTVEDMAMGVEGRSMALDRVSKLSDALIQTQVELINARAAVATAKASRNSQVVLRLLFATQWGNRNFEADPEADRLRAELERIDESLRVLLQHSTEEHEAVVSLRKKKEVVEGQLKAEEKTFAESYLTVLEQRVVAAKNTHEELLAEIENHKALVGAANVKSTEYMMLQSELAEAERLNEILDNRIKELSVVEGTAPMNITILETARPQDKPARPQKTRIMALALVAGLMLGIGLALLRDWTDQRLRSAEEITAFIGVPVLGVVPMIPGKQDTAEAGRTVELEPTSQVSEAYRTIRTGVYFGAPEGEAKTILVTSAGPGEGKTTLVCNLATAMAQAGQRVLLIDCDFRKPRIHDVFKMQGKAGLSNVLAGRADLAETIGKSSVEGLSILPCGQIPPNPSEMINSQAFLSVIQKLREQYDHIVIDSPPVMAVTDARILGAMCDQTLLVVRAEHTTRKAAEQARESLLSVGARILGVVVNALPKRKGRYGYYGDYGYGYGYGYGHDASKGKDQPQEKAEPPEAPSTGT